MISNTIFNTYFNKNKLVSNLLDYQNVLFIIYKGYHRYTFPNYKIAKLIFLKNIGLSILKLIISDNSIGSNIQYKQSRILYFV